MMAKVLVVANPSAGSNTGTKTARDAIASLEHAIASGKTGAHFEGAEIDAAFLSSAEQTRAFVEQATDFSTVLAVGGDGLVHLVANALMTIPQEERPVFGVVPAGTGNDFARALGLPQDARKALTPLLYAQPHAIDVGLCNGEYFVETLSFGLDAAIALDTTRVRAETGKSGASVYFQCGIDQLTNHLTSYSYRGSLGNKLLEGKCVTFAVQNGPYYGGGFKICPDAQLDDGILDLCVSHPPITIPRALYTFVRAKSGSHTKMKPVEMLTGKKMVIEFDEEPPCQIDGEPMIATRFEVACVPGALQVLF